MAIRIFRPLATDQFTFSKKLGLGSWKLPHVHRFSEVLALDRSKTPITRSSFLICEAEPNSKLPGSSYHPQYSKTFYCFHGVSDPRKLWRQALLLDQSHMLSLVYPRGGQIRIWSHQGPRHVQKCHCPPPCHFEVQLVHIIVSFECLRRIKMHIQSLDYLEVKRLWVKRIQCSNLIESPSIYHVR